MHQLCAQQLLLFSFCLLAAIAGLPALVVHAGGDSGWQTIKKKDGFTISMREPPGALPTFRGQGTLNGSVLHLLAIVTDDARSLEWSKGADKVYRLRTIDERASVVYSRSRQKWPAQDREVIMKRTVDVRSPGENYYVRLVCAPDEQPVPRDVIRLTDCDTSFSLRKVDAEHTYVEYAVRANPGGQAPLWLARLLSKDVPYEILTGLAKQVARTRGKYAAVIKEWESIR